MSVCVFARRESYYTAITHTYILSSYKHVLLLACVSIKAAAVQINESLGAPFLSHEKNGDWDKSFTRQTDLTGIIRSNRLDARMVPIQQF